MTPSLNCCRRIWRKPVPSSDRYILLSLWRLELGFAFTTSCWAADFKSNDLLLGSILVTLYITSCMLTVYYAHFDYNCIYLQSIHKYIIQSPTLVYLVGVLHVEYPKWLQGIYPRLGRNIFLKLCVRYRGAEISQKKKRLGGSWAAFTQQPLCYSPPGDSESLYAAFFFTFWHWQKFKL